MKIVQGACINAYQDNQPNPNPSLISRLPPLLPPLLLLLKLSQWWYSPSSPRTLSPLTGETNSVFKTHAAIFPPRPLPILPTSGLLPPTPPTTPPPDGLGRAESNEFEVGLGGYGKCPLCGKKWQNAAVFPSGWVVCWRCGWDAVEDEDEEGEEGEEENDALKVERRRGKCPITGVGVTPGELRRVLV